MQRLEANLEDKDRKIAFLEADKKVKDQMIADMERDIGQLKTVDTSVKRDIGLLKTVDTKMSSDIKQLNNKPFAFQCAWQDIWGTANSVITYDRLTYDEISGGSIYNVTGGLDINTGVFTVGHGFSGVWEVTYSIRSDQHNGENNDAWISINGEQIEESIHHTSYGGSEGYVFSLGSRSLYMRLESGDTISLRTGEVGQYLDDITLCFGLAQFDWVPPM